MIILISGKMGSGKSTVATELQKALSKNHVLVSRYRYAQPLYEMHDACLKVLKKYGIDRKMTKDGALLQILGTEYGRNIVDPDIWVKCAWNWYEHEMGNGAFFHRALIIDDMRFKNELTMFRKVPHIFIRLECAKALRKARCSNWRKNDKHQSEIDLDGWLDKFDLVVDTGKNPIEAVTKEVTEYVLKRLHSGAGTITRKKVHARRTQKRVEKEMSAASP